METVRIIPAQPHIFLDQPKQRFQFVPGGLFFVGAVPHKQQFEQFLLLPGEADVGHAAGFIGRIPSGGHILPAALRVFVEKVGPVFDTIVLDTAAGMGVPFEAAMGVAHRALLVLTPDPVSIRDGRIVCDALEAGGGPEIRLIINKVPRTLANCGIQSLDECIDTVGAQLIGVVPFSTEIQKAGATGAPLAPAGRPRLALRAIAARLCGQYTPLVIR